MKIRQFYKENTCFGQKFTGQIVDFQIKIRVQGLKDSNIRLIHVILHYNQSYNLAGAFCQIFSGNYDPGIHDHFHVC